MPIALVVHGGAWSIPDNQVTPHLEGCRAALAAGWALLEAGDTALAACEAAIRVLEDDPIFNAGTGSLLNAVGAVELDAALMDGYTLAYGAVANIQRVRNPITLARHVLQGPATLLAGTGAEQFAAAQGVPLCENAELIVERERNRWQRRQAKQAALQSSGDTSASAVGSDTVGAVALDQKGGLVAASSTGGTPFKLPGRVGDTPMVGCGIYADALAGACICTGWGEGIARMALARRGVELIERGISPARAASQAVALLSRRVTGGNGGCVLLNRRGQVGLAWNSTRMAYAYRVEGGEVIAGV
jgi:L-asparaginase / beta-aspartyl-peptidase